MSRARRKTLYLDRNGIGRGVMLAATILRGVFGRKDGDRPPSALARVPGVARLFGYLQNYNDRLSYINDWRDAFLRSSELDVTVCDMNDLVHLGTCLARVKSFDLIVVSHAAAGDELSLALKAAPALARRRCPIVIFLGNEYDLLDQKLEFCRAVGASLLCSQLPLEAARYLYGGSTDAKILAAPHALNPDVYRPGPHEGRDIDVGFVGDLYLPFVGDLERTRLIEYFERNGAAHGLRCDIRAGGASRMPREAWATFLRRCRGLIGAESGTYYLNEKGALLDRARAYNLDENRAATFDEVFARFYAGVPRGVSGKSISSRHFEAIGAKTCQVLIEGDYNGILKPGEHYIPVKADLSDAEEAIGMLRDETLRRRIADAAYDLVMTGHTYERRVADVLAELP
ncbi:MAG: glycosyltransferase family 1 protein [Azospirillum sp.]|nr:glycosyltransferase family 1 protein [Azospirillum sp.]